MLCGVHDAGGIMKRWQVGLALAYAQGYVSSCTEMIGVDMRDVSFTLDVSSGAVTVRFDSCIPTNYKVLHIPAQFADLLMEDIEDAQGSITVLCRDTTQGPNVRDRKIQKL